MSLLSLALHFHLHVRANRAILKGRMTDVLLFVYAIAAVL